jgi:hypothetical protein
VTLVLANGMGWNSGAASSASPAWLTVNVAAGSVTLNSNATFYGTLRAPASAVTLNSNARLYGAVIADRLALNGGAAVQAAP